MIDKADRMIDMLDAKTVEILLDDTGKLWINVDGACRLRIGAINHLSTTLDTFTVEWTRPETENAKA